MRLDSSSDLAVRTIYRDPEGRALYHIHTPKVFTMKTTTIYKISERTASRYEGKKATEVEPLPEEEIARIHWHWIHSTQLIYNGRSHDMNEFLRRRNKMTDDRLFTGTDGKEYKWTGIYASKLEADDGTTVINCNAGEIFPRRMPYLDIDDSLLPMLDLIIITFTYFDQKRLERLPAYQ